MHGWKGRGWKRASTGVPRQPFTRQIRNVRDRLPDKLRSVVTARIRRAYHADSALAAEAELAALAAELDKTHPGAAASLREGMAETLTVLRLGLPADGGTR